MNLVELGIALREKREEKGLEIKDVGDILKISTKVLIALEDANREKLPELAFRVAFVKSYCKFLELDETFVEEAIQCLTFVGEEPNYANRRKIENEYITNSLPEKKNLKIMIRVILAVAVILFAYIAATAFMESNFVKGLIEEAENSPYLNQENSSVSQTVSNFEGSDSKEVETVKSEPAEEVEKQEEVEEQTTLPNGMSVQAAAKLDELVQENLQVAIENSKNKKEPAKEKQEAEKAIQADERLGSGSQTLLIKAKDSCWMQITLDGKLVRGNYTLAQGSSILIEFNSRAIIFYGNPSGVEVEHNGVKQKVFPDTGKTLSVAY